MLQSGSTFLSGKIPRALLHFYWDGGKVAQINADQDLNYMEQGRRLGSDESNSLIQLCYHVLPHLEFVGWHNCSTTSVLSTK